MPQSGGLVLEDLHHSYDGQEVVRGVSLEINPGEVVSLLGPSGCGKTTCLRVTAGLETVQRGRVIVGGRVVGAPDLHVPPEQRGIGLVLQDYALFPHLSIIDNVAFGLRRTLSRQDGRRRAAALLERIGLAHHAEHFPHQLSGGEQQRVALARALAPQPRVMLMDEPFSGLDVTLRDRVRESAMAVLRETGVPTLMVTHDPEEAMRISDRVAVMKNGRILQSGTPADLYYRPASSEVVSFFGELNRFEAVALQGVAPTPLGDVPARGIPDGVPVEILVRPQALRLRPSADDLAINGEAVVVRSQLLGPSCLIDLQFETTPLRARVATRDVPRDGDRVQLYLHPQDVFVFPLAQAS
ncbi:MAG TPA: ABC transporter ATP-binding protein [Sphingomonadales bacterium]